MSKTTAKTTPNTDVIKAHSFKFAKATYNGLDLAASAEGLQNRQTEINDDKDVFGRKFILFAGTCKSSEEFLTLCGSVEARKSWKSKQNPQGTPDTMPAVWKQYKSNIKTAWEQFDITPKDVDTVSQLNKELNAARKAKNEADTAKTGDATTDAIVKAINVDSKLASAIGKLTKIFDKIDVEQQNEMLEELHTLANYFEDQLEAKEETAEEDEALAAEMAALEAHLEQQDAVQAVVNH